MIQETVTSLGKVVQEREILGLPLNGRNFTQLGTLQPGVVPLTPGLKEAGSSIRQGQSYAVNGQRPESNNFLIGLGNDVGRGTKAAAEFGVGVVSEDAEFRDGVH